MKQVVEKIRKKVIPSKKLQQEKSRIAKKAFELVSLEASKVKEILSIEFGGSYAKGTWLLGENEADIDIFIKFKETTSEKKFTEISKQIGFKAMKNFGPYVRYSEHPYVEAHIKSTRVNVVPCYDVKKGHWQSAADRSPFHTSFMLKSLTAEMKNEVRVLKKFLKANNIYGAEIANQGLSGYVSEVLIWNFGSFKKVIEVISKIKPNQIIGKSLKTFDTSIVIMDPIDERRNLAAAISDENIGKFILICRSFLKKPSKEFFAKKPVKANKDNLKNVIVVKFHFKPRSPDIIWGQAKRATSVLSTQLEIEGFRVLRKREVIYNDEVFLVFLFESLKIPENRARVGPEFFNEFDSAAFIEKNVKKSLLVWIGQNKKIISLEKRKFNDSGKFLKNILRNNSSKLGISKGLKDDIKNKLTIIQGNKISNKIIKEAISELITTDGVVFSSR